MPSKSAKQARFMRAVAHNPRFAKKAGVPQSVGRDYVDADKATGKYAGGGKVKKVVDAFRYNLGRDPEQVELDRFARLMDENPGVDRMVDLDTLVRMAAAKDDAVINLTPDEYINQALAIGKNYTGEFRSEANRLGKQINSRGKMHTLPALGIERDYPSMDSILRTTSHDGRHRAILLGDKGYKVPTRLIDDIGEGDFTRDSFVTKLEDALLMPERMKGQKQRTPLPLRKRAFAGGGRVGYADSGTMLERGLRKSNKIGKANTSERRDALLAKGLASMVGTLDEDTGEVGFGLYPGLIDEMAGLPAAFTDRAPRWSKDAARRTDRLRARIAEVMPDTHATGFVDNMAEAGGEMLGQLPVPGGPLKRGVAKIAEKTPSILRAAGKVPGALLEYLSPTINPSAGNYLGGTLAGAAVGYADSPNLLEPTDFDRDDTGEKPMFPNSPRGYADGGRALKTARAMKGIKDAITHLETGDRASAIRALSSPEVGNDSGIAQIISMLKSPQANSAGDLLRRTVETDTNVNRVPMLNGGGKVAKAKSFFKVMSSRTGQVKSILDDEDKAWNLADRLSSIRGEGHHPVIATEEEFKTFLNQPLKKSKGGKVEKMFSLVNWKDELTPGTRRVVDRIDAQGKKVPDRRSAPRQDISSLGDIDISDILRRKGTYTE